MLHHVVLKSTASKIANSYAATMKRDPEHRAWANVPVLVAAAEELVFFSPLYDPTMYHTMCHTYTPGAHSNIGFLGRFFIPKHTCSLARVAVTIWRSSLISPW